MKFWKQKALIVGIIVFVLFSLWFNQYVIELRLNEANYLLTEAAIDEFSSKKFNILAKYELIKRRIEQGEDDLQSYEIEGQIHAVTSIDTLSLNLSESQVELPSWHPVKLLFSTIRFLLGKESSQYQTAQRHLDALERGYMLERDRQFDDAVAVYDSILTFDLPEQMHSSVLLHKAFSLSMLSKYSDAAVTYKKVADEFAGSPDAGLAENLYTFINSIIKQKQNSTKPSKNRFARGKSLYSFMDYRGAIDELETYLKSDTITDLSGAHYFKGRAHEEIGEYRNAMDEYRKIMNSGLKDIWSKNANRRLVMLGDLYEYSNSETEKAKTRLVKMGDTLFINSVESSVKKSVPKKVATPLSQGNIVTLTVSSKQSKEYIEELEKERLLQIETEEQEKRAKEEIEKRQKRELELKRKREENLRRKELLASTEARSADFIKKFIDEHNSRLKKIYLEHKVKNQLLSGNIQVEMTIRASGNVKARVVKSTVNDRSFTRDIIDEIESWRFPEVQAELGEITITYPFSFK